MTRRRPSGANAKSTRLAKAPAATPGQEVTLPAVRATGVAWYVATADGKWPPRRTVMVDTEAAWIQENQIVYLQEMRPGHGMGDITTYRIVEIRNHLRQFPGTYGQILRLVLLVRVASPDMIEDLTADDMDGAL